MRSWRSGRSALTALGLIVWGVAVWPQTVAAGRQGAAPPPVNTRPPLLFKEEWKLPPHEGAPTDENMHIQPGVVANQRLEVKWYGPDASVVRAAEHEGRFDLWTGLATSPVAVTLRDKGNYIDLTGLARLRWIVRTTAIHTLYPGSQARGRHLHCGQSRHHDRRRVSPGRDLIRRHAVVQAGSGQGRRHVGGQESGSEQGR